MFSDMTEEHESIKAEKIQIAIKALSRIELNLYSAGDMIATAREALIALRAECKCDWCESTKQRA